MNMVPQKKNGAEILLNVLSFIAEKNASLLCKGLLYEPEMPKKLKR